jgi:hypothetical protein
MNLEVAQQIVGPARQRRNVGGIAAGRGDDIGDGRARCVAARQQLRLEPAGDHAAAEIGGAEAHALLLRERDKFEVEWQFELPARQLLGDHQRRGDPEPAVVLARIAHGVVVRADDQRLGVRISTREAADDVADRVDAGVEPGGLHPG